MTPERERWASRLAVGTCLVLVLVTSLVQDRSLQRQLEVKPAQVKQAVEERLRTSPAQVKEALDLGMLEVNQRLGEIERNLELLVREGEGKDEQN